MKVSRALIHRHKYRTEASSWQRFLILFISTMSILTKMGALRTGVVVDAFAWTQRQHRQDIRQAFRGRPMLFSTATTSNSERLFPEEINVLYDSKCNVCKLEMDWLVSRDIRINGPDNRKLKLTDLEDENGFDAPDPSNGGIDYDTGMAAIYAIKHDGTVYKGVPVFELAYAQVGLGWIWKINQIPAVNRFLEWGYEIFARNRTRITRGASLEELLALNAAKQKVAQEEDCESCRTKAIP